MKTKTLFTILAIVAAMDCAAQKEISSIYGKSVMYLNNEHKPRPLLKVLVITDTHDQDANEKIIKEFNKAGIKNTVLGLSVMPPVKEYSEADVKEICGKYHIDAIVKAVVKTESRPGMVRGVNGTHNDFEISLIDIQTNEVVVKFIGKSKAGERNKGIYFAFRSVMGELQNVVNL